MASGENRSGSRESAGGTGAPLSAAEPARTEPAAAEPAANGALSPEERKAILDRAVFELSREFRAEVRSRHDFDALLIRGRPVTHRLHFIALVLVVALTAALGRSIGFGDALLLPAVLAGGGYGLFWLFLTMTGGEERERLSVDEDGKILSVKSGRDTEARSDFLRVAIPTALLIWSGYIAVGLVRDIAVPPRPNCNVAAVPGSDACLTLPNLANLLGATIPPQTPGPGSSPAPAASPSLSPTPQASGSEAPGASPSPVAVALTVAEAQTVERAVRGFQLLVALLLAVVSAWFLRRMLTGRWVAAIRPVHHRLSDE